MSKLLTLTALLLTTSGAFYGGSLGHAMPAAAPYEHPGIIPNHLNRGGASATNNKVVIDLNHCLNEKRRAAYDVESAQNKLKFCEKENLSLRDEEEKCRISLHTLSSEAELLRQENHMLRLKVKYADDKDDQCGKALLDQQRHSESRVRAVVDAAIPHNEEFHDTRAAHVEAVSETADGKDNNAKSGPNDSTLGENGEKRNEHVTTASRPPLSPVKRMTTSGAELSMRARERDEHDSKVQQLEAKLLMAERDARGYGAQRRALENTIRELSHALEVERHNSKSLSRSRSRSRSLSPSLGAREESEDGSESGGNNPTHNDASVESDNDDNDPAEVAEEVVKARLRQAAQAAEASAEDQLKVGKDRSYSYSELLRRPKEYLSEEERSRERNKENAFVWKVRQEEASYHEAHRQAEAERLERLRKLVEDEESQQQQQAENEDGASL